MMEVVKVRPDKATKERATGVPTEGFCSIGTQVRPTFEV